MGISQDIVNLCPHLPYDPIMLDPPVRNQRYDDWMADAQIWGGLPDCAVSGARWWLVKDGNVALIQIANLDVVLACLRVIDEAKDTLVFWGLENPVGRLKRYLGAPRYYFQPYEYGDPWTKKTAIWGIHNIPVKTPVKPIGQWTGRADEHGIVDHFEYLPPDWVHKLPPSANRVILRSITPPGFARAFYEANK